MFEVNKIPLKNTGLFNKLVIDYLHQVKETTILYNQFPDLKGFQQFFAEENNFNKVNRTVLVKSLEAQANLVNN
ncbi:MAG: bacillithiol biosynthesis BshC, partial [Bacteroidia bacterium]|nr:bacillithiol biosynthesis BshC [Bacteroidia bacterium]